MKVAIILSNVSMLKDFARSQAGSHICHQSGSGNILEMVQDSETDTIKY